QWELRQSSTSTEWMKAESRPTGVNNWPPELLRRTCETSAIIASADLYSGKTMYSPSRSSIPLCTRSGKGGIRRVSVAAGIPILPLNELYGDLSTVIAASVNPVLLRHLQVGLSRQDKPRACGRSGNNHPDGWLKAGLLMCGERGHSRFLV